jgi:ParB-like chromosome segregation protein Spo0J
MLVIQVHVVPIDRIKPNPRNARTHSRKQVGEIADSIKAVGWTVPILIDEQQRLIAGHGRLEAAKTLGLKTVPTIMLRGLSDAKRRALALADNKIAENAGWDRELLAAELPELTELLIEEGLDISLTGFLPVEIDQLTVDFEDNAADPGDEVDPAWLKADPVCTENSNACVLMVQTTENSP